MKKNVLAKSLKRSLVVMLLMSMLLGAGGQVYAAEYSYSDVNKIIMDKSFVRGQADGMKYKQVQAMIDTMSNSYYKNALQLKLDTIVTKYNIQNVPGTPDLPTITDDSGQNGDSVDLSEDENKDENKDETVGKDEGNKTEPTEDTTIEDNKEKIVHKALLKGYPDGTIKPNGFITRAEVAAILSVERTKDLVSKTFKDLDKGHWSYEYVKNINIDGYDDNTFRGSNNITRAEALRLIENNLDIKGTTSEAVNYKDIKGHWAEDTIVSLTNKGVVKGYKDNTFKPNEEITRAEFIVFVNRAVRNCTLDGKKGYEDVYNKYAKEIKDHWAFDILMEAIVDHDAPKK